MLWSDHGWHLGEKQHWHKRTLWEEGTRIPMIVAAPQVGDAGQVCKQPASTVDLFPTLIELCNLNTPDQTLDGLSLVPWLKNPNKRRAQAAITVDEFKHKSARDQRYRYIQYNDGSEEFYDHLNDPNEWRNLINNPNYFTEIQRLKQQLPQNLAPSAREWKAFEFDPQTYSWVDKKKGIVINGQ